MYNKAGTIFRDSELGALLIFDRTFIETNLILDFDSWFESVRWEPKFGENYYCLDGYGDTILTVFTCDIDKRKITMGNCFETKEQAEAAAIKLREFFKSLHE